ncbi:hypothetical protein QWY85_02425 [Neolewinella lacunae]|uniref:Uncharacterized protein n=1 Tax=Neolewinella lacunae TaxID=1517758 RepID=A0A923PLI4_9BACT|nr:hypothetical protein [Neolewinella lacunae]MBC6994926.1 hypothetical protein [Neolewinella lacunae]MDN3633495.1 hypothetical protein [Neolewinella lacunae]
MYPLNEAYRQHLDAIAEAIQASPNLAAFLEEEEDHFYEALKQEFEPQIEQAHQQLIDYSPLEIESFEEYLLDDKFEGLFLPRALGYAVLRGEVTEYGFYARQNDHFGKILSAIAQNSNFDQLRSRIGQSVQCGFALSSDIFVTSMIDGVASKRVRQFLQGQRSSDARTAEGRHRIERRYRRQFKGRNYHYAPFPQTPPELTNFSNALIDFLLFRVSGNLPNEAITPTLHEMVTRPEFAGRRELLKPIAIYGAYLTPAEAELEELIAVLSRERQKDAEGTAHEILTFLLALKNNREVPFGAQQERALGTIVDRSIADELTAYFNLADKIHADGYVNPTVHDAILAEQVKHGGLSPFNENVRQTIFAYFSQLATGLGTEEADYIEWYDITGKQFPAYIKVFSNESFNQQLRSLAREYTRRLLKTHTNKRGKDYRDIKKTTMHTWQEYGFMTDKQLKEFFKTPRKKKSAAE